MCVAFSSSLFGFKHFVLISAPGSGKGTFSQYLVGTGHYVQICPGDILRNEIALKTELGIAIAPIVERGDYVDDKTVCLIVAKHIEQALAQNKYVVVDGFPRSDYSYQFLCDLFKRRELTQDVCFLQFLVSDHVCMNRVLDRIICTNCFKVYNNISYKPCYENICDDCGQELSVRTADSEMILKKRLAYFHNYIEKIIDQAQADGYVVNKVNGELKIDELKHMYRGLLV